MNPQFTNGLRSPTSNTGISFYNPQKETLTPNNPLLYQNNQPPNQSYVPNANSKSFVSRPNPTEQPKPANNTSVFVKSNNQTSNVPKFLSNNSMTANNYQSTNFNPKNYPPKISTQMTKSSFHENKTTENLLSEMEKKNHLPNTPTKRAPRMSQTLENTKSLGNFGNIDYKPPSYTSNSQHQIVLNQASGLKKSKEFDNNFFKPKHLKDSTLESTTGNQKKEEKIIKETTQKLSNFNLNPADIKTEPWQKKSLGKKKIITSNDFEKIKQLGSGKYGHVFLVREKSSNFICALKLIEKKLLKEEQITDQFIRELKIQMYLNHPNIIKMYGYFDDEVYIYIILEVGTGGQLYHQLKKSQQMTENKVANILKQVCDAVNEIHSRRIIHRDIKPENIVLHDNVIKLCDFGWSVYQDNKLRTTFCGTPLYVCPEILKGKEYDEKIDIWSLGIMMYEMLVGENPFKITKQEELIRIVKDQIAIPSYVFVSREARDFLDKCLKKNPADRSCIKQLANHDFILKNADKEKKIQM